MAARQESNSLGWKNLLPTAVRVKLGRLRRGSLLRRGIRRLQNPPWNDLVAGWTNEEFSALPEYLEAVVAYARSSRGAVLECGSGLTTVVLAALGIEACSLEHDPIWFGRVRHKLDELGLDANIQLAPLRDYGDIDWYDVDPETMPGFHLVVCDGPPGDTRGGRSGLVTVLGDRLLDGCIVLLDDATRESEIEVLNRWDPRIIACDIRGSDKPYAVVTLAAAD